MAERLARVFKKQREKTVTNINRRGYLEVCTENGEWRDEIEACKSGSSVNRTVKSRFSWRRIGQKR